MVDSVVRKEMAGAKPGLASADDDDFRSGSVGSTLGTIAALSSSRIRGSFRNGGGGPSAGSGSVHASRPQGPVAVKSACGRIRTGNGASSYAGGAVVAPAFCKRFHSPCAGSTHQVAH